MNAKFRKLSDIPPVFKAAIVSTCAAILLAAVDVRLSSLPLALFLIACIAAPFFPGVGFFLPIISHGCTGKNMVALTFDDGPDPLTTPQLLKLLARYNIKATFFVIGEKAERYPELVREIIAAGHDVGNHSYSHDPFLMLRSSRGIYREILAAQQALAAFSIVPRVFRPPAGVTNPKLGKILRKMGLCCVSFSCRAFDAGNRNICGLGAKILKKVGPDDIIVLHDTRPKADAAIGHWLQELELIVAGLKGKGLEIIHLSALTGVKVMDRVETST